MKLKRFDELNEEIGGPNWQREESDDIVLNLTREEAQSLLYCLSRTMAKGEQLTIGMEVEDRLSELVLKK